MSSARRLIVNADDYGYSPGVSAGIREAHLRGIVTSTSALARTPSAKADLAEAAASCPKLGIGVHLALTSVQLQFVLERADAREIYDEWRAQIEAVAEAGVDPDHLDSHRNVAYASPALLEVYVRLANEYELPVRLSDGARAPGDLQGRVRHPDTLVTGFFGEGATAATLGRVLAELPAGVTELMCHPGHVDAALRAASSYRDWRERELALLTRPEWGEELKRRGIQLVTFASLARPAAEIAARH
jgi:predicted glycoside hydrolase/deacetylase ChbG (UPF0249 family)